MPKVVITFDEELGEYYMDLAHKDLECDPEYQAVMDMKASHYRNMLRNQARFVKDRETLARFFTEAQQRGRQFRER